MAHFASTFSSSGDISGEMVLSISGFLYQFRFSLRPEIAVAVRDLRSGLFWRRELAHAIPAKHRRAGHGGFGIVEDFDRYPESVGLDLVP